MAGFCPICGNERDASGRCSESHTAGTGSVPLPPHTSPVPAATESLLQTEIGPFPKASTARRFLGSGIEFITYLCCTAAILVLDVFTLGMLGVFSLFLVGLIVLRDFNAGLFSIAKRVSQMRVVDSRTGRPATNVQSLLRNSYYLALPLAAALLPLGDVPLLPLFLLFIVIDVMMIWANPHGRRLGDLLAGTQVVATRA